MFILKKFRASLLSSFAMTMSVFSACTSDDYGPVDVHYREDTEFYKNMVALCCNEDGSFKSETQDESDCINLSTHNPDACLKNAKK